MSSVDSPDAESPDFFIFRRRSLRDAQLLLSRGVRNGDMQSVRARIVSRLQTAASSGDLRISLRRRPVEDHDLHCLPPRRVASFALAKPNRHALALALAAEILPQELAVLIGERMAVV